MWLVYIDLIQDQLTHLDGLHLNHRDLSKLIIKFIKIHLRWPAQEELKKTFESTNHTRFYHHLEI